MKYVFVPLGYVIYGMTFPFLCVDLSFQKPSTVVFVHPQNLFNFNPTDAKSISLR